MDDAASAIRIEIDSKPIQLDRLEKKIRQLEIEKEALKKEEDKASVERLNQIDKDLSNLREEYNQLEIHWRNEKDIIDQIKQANKNLDELREEAIKVERTLDLQRVAEINYGLIPEQQKLIEQSQLQLENLQKDQQILKEEVTKEDIAKIDSR